MKWYISRAQCLYLDRRKEVWKGWWKRGYFPRVSVKSQIDVLFFLRRRAKRDKSQGGDRDRRKTEEEEQRQEEGRERKRERVEGHDLRTGVYHRWGIYFGAVITTCPSLSSLFLANNELQPFRRRERRGECRGGRRPVAYPGPRVGVIANVITHVAQTSPCFTLSYVHADRGCGPRIIPLPVSSTVFEDDRGQNDRKCPANSTLLHSLTPLHRYINIIPVICINAKYLFSILELIYFQRCLFEYIYIVNSLTFEDLILVRFELNLKFV